MTDSVATELSGLSPPLIAARTCFIALLGMLIVGGNVLCIAVTRRVPNLADSTRVLMTTLGVCDLSVGVFTALFNIIPSALDRWPYGDVMCRINTVVSSVCVSMSICSLCYLNIERFIAVTLPYKFPIWCSRRRIIILVLASLTMSLSIFIPTQIVLLFPARYYPISAVCLFNKDWNPMNIVLLVFADIGPTLVMTCLYSRLIQISRQHERRARANDPNGANNFQDHKALKVFLLVTLTFACCFTPFCVWKTVNGFTGEAIPHWLEFVLTWLPVSNSAFNVFIYCLFHRVYRQTAKKILAERFPCFKGSVAPVNI